MKTEKILLFMFSLLGLAQCNHYQEYPDNPLAVFDEVVTLEAKDTITPASLLGSPITNIFNHKNHIFLATNIKNRYGMAIVNKKNENVTSYTLKIGKGPYELIKPSHIRQDPIEAALNIFDKGQYIYFQYPFNRLLSKGIAKPDTLFSNNTTKQPVVLQPLKLGNKHFFTTAMSDEGRFVYFNEQGEMINTMFGFPDDSKHQKKANQVKVLAYQTYLAAQPNGKHFASATAHGVILDFFKTKGEHVNKIKSISFFKPDYRVKNSGGSYSAPINGNSKHGILDVASTHNYFYVLYPDKLVKAMFSKGRFLGEYVLVFTWQGKPVKAFQLRHDASAIGVDRNSNKLYTVENRPKPVIVEYPLPLQ